MGKLIKGISLAIVMLLLISALAGCGGSGSSGGTGGSGSSGSTGGAGSSGGAPAEQSKAIVIGVMGPTSGSEAYYGNDMYQSYQLAVDEINEAGGILGRQVTLYSADDG